MGKKYQLHDFSQIPTFTEIAKLKEELESIRTKLPKWNRCDEPDEDWRDDVAKAENYLHRALTGEWMKEAKCR